MLPKSDYLPEWSDCSPLPLIRNFRFRLFHVGIAQVPRTTWYTWRTQNKSPVGNRKRSSANAVRRNGDLQETRECLDREERHLTGVIFKK